MTLREQDQHNREAESMELMRAAFPSLCAKQEARAEREKAEALGSPEYHENRMFAALEDYMDSVGYPPGTHKRASSRFILQALLDCIQDEAPQ